VAYAPAIMGKAHRVAQKSIEVSARQRAWSETLARHGSVEFRRSRRTILPMFLVSVAFVAIGVVMLASSHGGGLVIATACVLFFGLCSFVFLQQLVKRTPVFLVDRSGVHVQYRRPLDIPWEQIHDLGTFKYSRFSPAQLVVRTWPEALMAHAQQSSSLMRGMVRLSQGIAPGEVRLQFLDSPAQIAGWLDGQVDLLAAVPRELVVFPAEGVSAVWGVPSLRPFPLERMGISPELARALADFGLRAAPVAENQREDQPPGPQWAALAAEGRDLCLRLEHELGAGSTVAWFEDGPRA
jgi:hypothetical protein